MDVTTILFSFQRPRVLEAALKTLLRNTKIIPKDFYILDDGSDKNLQQELLKCVWDINDQFCPAHLYLAAKNRGISYNFELGYNIMRASESNGIFAFIESDYIFRKGYLEDVIAVFEASPYTIAIAGVDHPDMVDRQKTHGTFVNLMTEQFGEDVQSRSNLYNEFELETTRGKIKVRSISNSCGCMFIHWGRLKKILKEGDIKNNALNQFGGIGMSSIYSTEKYWEWMDRAWNKHNPPDRKYASDGHLSCTLTYFAEKYMIDNHVDISKNFGMLSISDRSISQHLCGGGVNGGNYPEGSTFVISPTFHQEDLDKDPRE